MKRILFLTFISTVSLCTPPEYGVSSMQGRRPTMEDMHDVSIESDHAFFGLYDGHCGADIAQLAATTLRSHCNLAGELAIEKIKENLIAGFKTTHENVPKNIYMGGSTAIVATIKNNCLFIANAGDSRAVLCKAGKAVALSTDHKAEDNLGEQTRILELADQNNKELVDVLRVNGGILRVFGSLAVTRSLGDRFYTPYVIPDPEIKHQEIEQDDEFLILACDGLWDVCDNQDAVDIVSKSLHNDEKNFEKAAEALKNHAYKNRSTDNISVIVVSLETFKRSNGE